MNRSKPSILSLPEKDRADNLGPAFAVTGKQYAGISPVRSSNRQFGFANDCNPRNSLPEAMPLRFLHIQR